MMEANWIPVESLTTDTVRKHLESAGVERKQLDGGPEVMDCPNLYWLAGVTEEQGAVRFHSLIPVRSDCEITAVKQLCQTVNEKYMWPKAYYFVNDDQSVGITFEVAIPLDSMGFLLPQYLAATLLNADEVAVAILKTHAAGIHAM
jgi:hypothetical protein